MITSIDKPGILKLVAFQPNRNDNTCLPIWSMDPARNASTPRSLPLTDQRSIEEICGEQSSWLTGLEKQIEKDKFNLISLSPLYGRVPDDLPAPLILASCLEEEYKP